MNINPFIELVATVLNLYSWVLIVSIVFSWLIAFNVVNPRNRVVDIVYGTAVRLTEPVLSRVRRFMPNLGAIDISPIVVFLGINFLQSVLFNYFYVM